MLDMARERLAGFLLSWGEYGAFRFFSGFNLAAFDVVVRSMSTSGSDSAAN